MILPEIVEIGFYDSNIADKGIKISRTRKTTMFELELPVEDGGVSYVDSESKKIMTNTLMCIKPGQLRHTKFPFKCYFIHMNVYDGALKDILMRTPTFFETDKAQVYKEIFLNLLRHYVSFDDNEEIILQSLILELIYTISKDYSLKNKKGALSDNHLTVERAISYINSHLTEDLSLERLSREMSFSPVYFHNTFKNTVGKTLRDFIEEQRIKKATHLLLTTTYSLTQIAYECGFSSQSYFSYVFKRRMKMTPREYIKTMHKRYEM